MSDLQDVRNRMIQASQAAQRADFPQLVAVSKTQTIEKMMTIYEEGQKIFGENYVQELVEKKTKLNLLGVLDADFHFIGHLQSNKVKLILPHVSTIHSVDSLRLLEEIADRALQFHKKVFCYFEVNIDDEPSKGGFKLVDLPELARNMGQYLESIQPLGLMCIPKPDLDPIDAFQRMKALSIKWGEHFGYGLSMGMSNDFEAASMAGSTAIRVGSAIFK